MAWLEKVGDSVRLTLPARCLVGRAANCVLRPVDRRVSGEHATIAWTGSGWEIRDLGSRNGTFVNEARLESGTTKTLQRGDKLAFGGSAEGWLLADAGPPVATARLLDDAQGAAVVTAEDGLLALPSAQDPRATVFEDLQGGWLAEVEGEARRADDGDVLTVGEQAWMLHLPRALDRTVDADAGDPVFALLEFKLTVSSDEEDVGLSHQRGGRWQPLGARSHHHLLLLLARARLEDAAQPSLAATEHGWRYVDDVCRMLQIDDLRLNTEIYRARKELSAAGIQGATKLVERRRASRSLRIGTASVTVE